MALNYLLSFYNHILIGLNRYYLNFVSHLQNDPVNKKHPIEISTG